MKRWLGILLALQGLLAQERGPEGIYIIFDASGSMVGRLPDQSRKIDAAKKVLHEFLGGDFTGSELAFRIYGHRRKGDCTDSEMAVPFGAPGQAVPRLRGYVPGIQALGETPITFSLREALKDFGGRTGEIILITDGIESCQADPCALVREWRKTDVKIRVHVVGLGIDEKSQGALRCISDAAGTPYHDAGSAAALTEELAGIRDAASRGLILRGLDAKGIELKVEGTVSKPGGKPVAVESYVRNRVDAGEYGLEAGVRTRNGNLYRPVRRKVEVAKAGLTTVTIEAATPPAVRVKFVDRGETKLLAGVVKALQNGREVFQFRAIDEVYLDEGKYQFTAEPNPESHLSLTESFAAGDRKEIVFRMIQTVKVTAKIVASGSGHWFRENTELWQGDEKKYTVHLTNGAEVLPGTYDLRLPNELTPFVKPGIVVSSEESQHFSVTVPVGHVTVVYRKADGTPDKDKRCFVGRGPAGAGVYRMSGEKIPLTPGTYNLRGWQGNYDRPVFEVKEGEDKTLILRSK